MLRQMQTRAAHCSWGMEDPKGGVAGAIQAMVLLPGLGWAGAGVRGRSGAIGRQRGAHLRPAIVDSYEYS